MPRNSTSLPARRRARVLEIIGRNGSVTVPELAVRFAVSLDTIRRDLDQLARSGALVRAHGGAMRAKDSEPLRSFADREHAHPVEKAAIARACAALIRDGETVLVNGGTTTMMVVDALRDHTHTVLLTNNIGALDLPGIERFASVHVLGGEFIASTRVNIGAIVLPNAERMNIDTAVIGVRALSADKGIFTHGLAEAVMIAEMMALAQRTIVVADSTKLDTSAFAIIAPLSRIDILVTDHPPAPALRAALTAAAVEVVVALPDPAAPGGESGV
ncbi:MAG: DeoR/GlpR family DNA-binding transcription regulator [Acetobacteraceae bacterium]|nr:DeoR/GlpR family DNA-binding transcription regulator [Acetobacteraceae bacterium]